MQIAFMLHTPLLMHMDSFLIGTFGTYFLAFDIHAVLADIKCHSH